MQKLEVLQFELGAKLKHLKVGYPILIDTEDAEPLFSVELPHPEQEGVVQLLDLFRGKKNGVKFAIITETSPKKGGVQVLGVNMGIVSDAYLVGLVERVVAQKNADRKFLIRKLKIEHGRA